MTKKQIRNVLLVIVLLINAIRGLPHLIMLYFHRNKPVIYADVKRWLNLMQKDIAMPLGFIYLMVFYQQFRNLFYYRVGTSNLLLRLLYREMSSLTIATGKIGEGLFLPHGFSTTIGAVSIGRNCNINHNVTIGTYGNEPRPVIGDNVIINAGAVVFGNITIGNNVVIGANATVNTNIPDNCTVFPPSSRIMKWSSAEKRASV
ncbi:MAG TPA: serine acetyltransferase [Bacteroidales bacterium]|nr:serine acetyltransferase [Bacteroidales bacterium]